ncbi:hypothetical protein OEZ85_013115 [Tetradesmus obliquus]|uniref:Dynein axonemal intermediate chain 4 n=1 Tax=Tetradesmus obliquus TaxID=3088 RepID=A0ABY8U8P4_TETOB|nr:hypothetical protein OEZ85_013115 [Tetradesmus obliquus]
MPAGHGPRVTGGWGPNRPGGVPGGSRRSYRSSNVRRSTSSRTHDMVDGLAPIKLIDEQGVNRTPKPLVAIVTSAALRQARGIVTEESVAGSDAGDGLFGEGRSSAGFSRGWFDSGTATPQEADPQEYQGRMMVPSNAAIASSLAADRSLTAIGGSSMGVSMFSSNRQSNDTAGSQSSSARPTGTPPAASAAATAAAAVFLNEDDLSKPHKVLLQDSGTVFMWEVPGVVVAADSAEGSQVAAANSQYAAQLAARDASDKFTASSCQTLVPLRKHREVQSGTSSSSDAGCQASRWDIDDSYAALERSSADDGEEQLGSVLPSGAVVATGVHSNGYHSSSQQASFMRSSQQNWGRPSNMSAAAGSNRRTTNLDSCVAGAWGRPSSSMRGSQAGNRGEASYSGSTTGAAAAAALLAAAGPQPEPWTRLAGLAEALAVMEAAVSQNIFLPQLLQYRDIKPPLPPSSQPSAVLPDDPLAAGASTSSTGSQQLAVALPPTPGMMSSRPSVALLSSRGAAADAWASSPHGSFGGAGTAAGSTAGVTPSLGGGASAAGAATPGAASAAGGLRPAGSMTPGSLAGAAGLSQLSRRPSQQLPAAEGAGGSRQSSFVSMSSSRLMRGSRPPAGLQLLWTWSCSLTEGMPVTSIAWNSANTNLIAAGYRANPAAAAAAAEAEAAGRPPGSAGSSSSSAGRPATAARSIRESMKIGVGAGEDAGAAGASAAAAAAAEVAGITGGRVALWSLKNQLHPIWTFETKSAVTALDFSQRNPHILGVGTHDGTIAVYDVRLRQPTPLMASTADTGKHADPVWKVRWLDRGPEREELLVSISTDGKVKAWTIAKGLEHSTLITLKRTSKRLTSAGGSSSAAAGVAAAAAGAAAAAVGLPAGSGAKAAATVAALRHGVAGGDRDALISRNTGGMSFDFSSTDSRIYLAGTEDGHIHKCSTSYSEQYLESYSGHIGPVYALQWSPFAPNLFLSCSGDWTIRMWQEGRQQQLLSFQSSNEEVLDVQWCPSNSTCFGAVTAGGRLELWDFGANTLRPVVQHASTKCAMTALLFAKDAPVVVAASDAGGLLVFRLVNVAADRFEPPELQQTRLEEALRANVMKAALSGAG